MCHFDNAREKKSNIEGIEYMKREQGNSFISTVTKFSGAYDGFQPSGLNTKFMRRLLNMSYTMSLNYHAVAMRSLLQLY